MVKLLSKFSFIKWPLIYAGLFLSSGISCVNTEKPSKEYLLAEAAYNGAVDSDASRYAPNLYHKAERYFKRAVELYEDRSFEKAQVFFTKARGFAERAEDVARYKQFKSGDFE